MLFIGNPTYEKILENTDLNLSNDDDLIPKSDDIYGVEFYGHKYDIPTTNDQVTPYSLMKAKRLFSAQKLKFAPSTTTVDGIDEFFQYAGPFQIRECATINTTITNEDGEDVGCQKIVKYKDQCSSMDEWRTYDNSTTTQYNIFIEYPRFWYCRPSRYTFLLTTKPNRSSMINDGKSFDWHISPMFKRQIWNDPGNYDTCTHAYISKYRAFWQTDTKTFLCNRRQCSHGTSTAGIKMGSTAQILQAFNNQGMGLFDYPCFTSLWMLLFVKYATLDFGKYLGENIMTAGVMTHKTDNITFYKNILTKEETAWSPSLFNSYPHMKYTVPEMMGSRNISSNTDTKMMGLVAAVCDMAMRSISIMNNVGYMNSSIINDSSVATSLATYATGNNFTQVGTIKSSTDGNYGNFMWSESMANNENIAYALLSDYVAQNNVNLSFFRGYHFYHFGSKNCHYITRISDSAKAGGSSLLSQCQGDGSYGTTFPRDSSIRPIAWNVQPQDS